MALHYGSTWVKCITLELHVPSNDNASLIKAMSGTLYHYIQRPYKTILRSKYQKTMWYCKNISTWWRLTSSFALVQMVYWILKPQANHTSIWAKVNHRTYNNHWYPTYPGLPQPILMTTLIYCIISIMF